MESLEGTQHVHVLNQTYKPTVCISRYAVFSFCEKSFILMNRNKPVAIKLIIDHFTVVAQ